MTIKTLDKLQLLQKELLRQYPNAVIVTPVHFSKLHLQSGNSYPYVNESINYLDEQGVDYICYILPPGEGTSGDSCCNGIKYGFDGDYISFLHLSSELFA